AGTSQQQAKVNTVVKEWFPYANVVFQPAASGGMLRITFDPKLGSWSYGADNLRIVSTASATMNFGWVKDTKAIAEEERGVILHEFGHVLGLLHQSPARGGTITLDEEAVYGYYGYTQGWSRETVKAQIIDVFNAEKLISNYSRLDIKSIMMYFMPSWLNLQHIDVKANYALSDIDKAYMVINYPRNGSHADAPQWTLDYALRVADVDAVTTEAIRKARGDATEKVIFPDFFFQLINTVAVRIPEGEEPEGDFGWCGAELPEQMSTPIVLNPGEDEIEDRGIAVSGVDAARGVFEADDDRGRRIQLWAPYTTLNYGFLNPEKATPYRRARVANALLLFAQNSSLTFRERDLRGVDLDNEDNRREHPIRIFFGERIAGTLTLGVLGWSSVGRRQIDGTPRGWRNRGVKWTSVYMNDQPLNSDDELDKDSLNWANNTLYHELLHALGMEHEQDSEHTLLKEPRDTRQTFISTAFDHDSVMLYRDLAYRDAQAYGKVTHLNPWPSPTDLDLLRLMYPDNRTDGKLAAALITMDFTAAEQVNILNLAENALGPGTVVSDYRLEALRMAITAGLQRKPRLSLPPLEDVPDIGRGVQNGTQPPFDPRANPSTPGFLSQLIQKLQEIFTPLSNQQFTLQFPGRYLDRESYAWDTSSAGPYGQFIKPVVVNESEFRLVDQMYDIAPVVAGPNGQNLSIIYNQVLNNLLPKFVENGLAQQQDQIRRWMLREVPMTQWIRDIMARQHAREQDLAASIAAANSARKFATVPQPVFDISNKAVGETLNRIELSELLMNEYLYTKQDWELERDRLINQATQRSLNALTRQLAHITDTRQAQLASKYADAVVRGYTHTVRQYMGYLDISNPAEALQDAKDSYREAAMSSLDGSMNVFPVQLTPLDWFVGLTTSFTLEDLTQDPEVIRLQISAKSNELDSLNSNLVALEMGSTGDVEALRKQVSDAQDALTVAQGQVAEKYTSNVVALAQTYLTKLGDVDVTRLALALKVAPEALAPLKEQMKSVQLAQDALLKSTRALSQLTAASALAEATDTRQQQQQIRLQIQTTIAELKELQTRFASLTAKTGGADAVRPASQEGNEVPTTPPVLPDEGTSGGSRWQTIMFTSRADERQRANAHSSNAKARISFLLNALLTSVTDAAASQASVDSSDTIDIAFRATLVTVDRGGWFQPQFFSESRAFYKVNPEISWAGPRGLLQGFPIAYLLVKDVVVRVTHQYIASASEKRNEAESAASAGGFLCFSYSSSSSSTSGSESSSYQQFSNGYIVKIPGPQILGYMVQLTGPDESELMPAELPKDFFIPDDEYERTLLGEDGQPVDPSRGLEPEARKLEITEEKLKKAMDAMLNEKVGELFRTLVAEESEPRR
ncbi:hypothetical protein C8F01DRAFT_977064, partial [Mycena amicta]